MLGKRALRLMTMAEHEDFMLVQYEGSNEKNTVPFVVDTLGSPCLISSSHR